MKLIAQSISHLFFLSSLIILSFCNWICYKKKNLIFYLNRIINFIKLIKSERFKEKSMLEVTNMYHPHTANKTVVKYNNSVVCLISMKKMMMTIRKYSRKKKFINCLRVFVVFRLPYFLTFFCRQMMMIIII